MCDNFYMVEVTEQEFQALVDKAIESLPAVHKDNIKNVAFFVKQNPSERQLTGAGVRQNGLLLGLYEGVPLPRRQGLTKTLPDTITLFKEPLQLISPSKRDLAINIRHTVWNEVAHYFGLDHDRIDEIESNFSQNS